jgi:capsular exopolysaccharide synthesis family protein
MSHIFEALQRAEAERSGSALTTADSVADLLKEAMTEDERVTEVASRQHSSSAVESPDPKMFAAAPVLVPTPSCNDRLVCLTDQGSLAAEKFRVLGLRLRHLREKRKLRRIVVTSTIPEEGKSLIACNLALNQARSKVLKTVLIDGDLRRPTQADKLGFSRNLAGLSECLRGERKLAEVVYKLDPSGLWFLPAGSPPENPIELMQAGHLLQILDQLGTFFDWIIIDSPPIFPLADTPLWMKLADGVLLVTREGVSEKKLITRAVEALDPANLIGIVVNSCSGTGQNYYYSRYSPDLVRSGGESSASV